MLDLVQQASSAALGRTNGPQAEEEELVEVMGCLSDLRMFAKKGESLCDDNFISSRAERGAALESPVTKPSVPSSNLTSNQAELLFLRAVSAVSVHRKRALTQQQIREILDKSG